MNTRNYRRRPSLAPDGSGRQDTPPSSAPLGFRYLPPLPTAQAKTRLRMGLHQETPHTAPGGKEPSEPPQREHRALGRSFPGSPWPWLGRDAQPSTSNVTKGSANQCLLHLRSTLLSPTHTFFKTQI